MKPGYKQTEAGVIPEEWEVKLLSSLSADIGDGIHSTPNYVNSSEFHFVNGNNLVADRISINDSTMCVSEAEYKTLRKNLTDRTLLLSINGTIGNLAFYNGEQVVLGKSAAYINVRKGVSRRFISYCLKNRPTALYFDNELTGTTISNLSLQSLRNTPIPLPPTLPEQRAIATALNDVDGLLGGLDRLIAKKRDLKQAAMQQLLTGQTRLPGFRGEWEVTTLGDTCAFENGDRGINYPSPRSFVHSGIPFVNAGHVDNGRIGREGMDYITKESFDRLGGGKFKSGDILFCLRGSLGKFGVVEPDFGEGAIASSMVIVRPKSTILDADYLSCYFKSHLCAQMIERWAGGAAQPNLGAQDLSKFIIRLPTLREQTAIAEVLTEMDAELAALEQRREKTRALKQAMMQELLTGSIRLV